MILPSVIVIAALLLALGRTVMVSMDCQSAAAAAARQFVVSGDEPSARATAAEVAGDGARTTVTERERTVQVRVECPVLPGPLDLTPVRVGGEATVMRQ